MTKVKNTALKYATFTASTWYCCSIKRPSLAAFQKLQCLLFPLPASSHGQITERPGWLKDNLSVDDSEASFLLSTSTVQVSVQVDNEASFLLSTSPNTDESCSQAGQSGLIPTLGKESESGLHRKRIFWMSRERKWKWFCEKLFRLKKTVIEGDSALQENVFFRLSSTQLSFRETSRSLARW